VKSGLDALHAIATTMQVTRCGGRIGQQLDSTVVRQGGMPGPVSG